MIAPRPPASRARRTTLAATRGDADDSDAARRSSSPRSRAWLAIGALGLVRPRDLRFVSRVLFPAGAAVGARARGRRAASRSARRRSRRCCRSACRTCRSTCASTRCRRSSCCCSARRRAAISLFSAGYFRSSEGTRAGPHLLPVPRVPRRDGAGADRRRRLRCSWSRGRSMALASFFLVTTDHRIPEIRRAGFLYLLIAHVGAIAILLCFGVLQGGSGDYTFDAMRAQHAAPARGRRIAFFLALVRLRRQGRPAAAARLAARGASGGALAGLGADERRDAEDRDLRPAARDLRPAARASSGGGAWSRWRSGSPPRSSAWSSPRCRPT